MEAKKVHDESLAGKAEVTLGNKDCEKDLMFYKPKFALKCKVY